MKKLYRSVCVFLALWLVLSLFPAFLASAEGAALNYAYANALPGDGQGVITLSGLAGSGYYSLYFANGEEILEHYEPIASGAQSGSGASVTLPRAFLLPPEATSIALFESAGKTPQDLSLSGAAALYTIPAEKRLGASAPSMTFASVSDAHLNYDDNGYGASAKWTAALNFFAENGMDYVMLSGDITGSGSVTEYERYAAATAASSFPKENIFEAQGNHDSTQVPRFLSYTSDGNEDHPFEGSAWFSVLFEGENGARDNLFIFMAQELSSTSGTPTTDNFSKKQLDWVEGLLQTYAGTDTNIFLVEHSMIRNFGPGDKYNGVYVEPMYFDEQFPGNMRFKALLTEYKEIIMMSGHTHLSLYEGYNYGDENGTAARMIHNSSTSQPRSYTASGSISYNSEGRTTETAGSEGYLVYVYEDAVCYVGHNLTTGMAIPTASYVIPTYSEDRSAALSIEVTVPPVKTEYEYGEWFDASGMVVTATYEGGETAPVKGWSLSNVGALKDDDVIYITYGSCAPVPVQISVGEAPVTPSLHGEEELEGQGTYEDPFLISTPADFAALTACFNNCSSTSEICGAGYFYRQTADIDMTGYEGYEGTHANGNAKRYFGGIYDGAGHTLKVTLNESGQTSVFPYIYGAIYNLKIEGSINSSESAQPVRTIQSGAVVANCLIDMTLTSGNANGVCYTNYGTVYNVYVTGRATHAAHSSNSGKYYNAYAYVLNAAGTSTLTTSVATITNDLEAVEAGLSDRESAAAQSGIAAFTAKSPNLSVDSLGPVTLVDGVLVLGPGTGSEVVPTLSGKGTAQEPYIIATPDDFKLLTDFFNASVSSSDPYGKGEFFLQTADIDMTGYEGYAGTHASGNGKCYFGGIYNGGGHTLKVTLEEEGQTSIFPYIYGAVINLRFEGSINSTESAQPVRTVQSGAVVANCLIDMTLTSKNANGICYTHYGTVYNVYVTGRATHAAHSSNSGKYYNTFAYVYNADGSALLTTSVATITNDVQAVSDSLNDRTGEAAASGLAALTALNDLLTAQELLPVHQKNGAVLFGEEEFALGDVNHDRTVDINDVSALLDILASGDPGQVDPAADLSGNGQLNISDVTLLLDLLAGRRPE